MEQPAKEKFIGELKSALKDGSFVKLILSKPIMKSDDLERISMRIVKIKTGQKQSFVYKHKTKDITKNYSFTEGINKIKSLLGEKFKNSILFTTKNDIQISFNKKMEAKINNGNPTYSTAISKEHNREKIGLISIENNKYLKELGVATANNQIVRGMQGKFRQINKYIETIDGIIRSSNLVTKPTISIVDMGAGKGYLTFAIYDYLVNTLKIETHISGIEIRENLVDLCNNIAKGCDFKNLKFHKSNIKDYKIKDFDILVALHACDTATDDAIYKGITSGASIIITAPCCHRQIRNELKIKNQLKHITKYGILEERLAEMVTDTMRAMILEAYGYKTQVFEFISDEHTHKNVMIVGIKNKQINIKNKFFNKIDLLKKEFGIENFYLENLFFKN